MGKQTMTTERFIVLCGQTIEPWVYTDEPFKMDRKATVDLVASGEPRSVAQIIAFDVAAGTCRDATKEIAREVMDHWADAGEPLTYSQREFMEFHISVRAANSFAQAAE